MRPLNVRDPGPSARGVDMELLVQHLYRADLSALIAELGPSRRRFDLPDYRGSPLERALNDQVKKYFALHEAVAVRWAIADVLSPFLDADGCFDHVRLAEQYPGAGIALLSRLGLAIPVQHDAPAPLKWHDRDHILQKGIGPFGSDLSPWPGWPDRLPTVPFAEVSKKQWRDTLEAMPVVDAVIDEYGSPELLRDTALFAIQHLFGSTLGMLKAMVDRLDLPSDERTSLLGKVYSTPAMALHMFRDASEWGQAPERAWSVSNLHVSHGLPGDPEWVPRRESAEHLRVHPDQVQLHLFRWATRIGLEPPYPSDLPQVDEVTDQHFFPGYGGDRALPHFDIDHPLPAWSSPVAAGLLLDDGAEAIVTLCEDPNYEDRALPMSAVEQTAYGIWRVEDLAQRGQLKLSVVDVARAPLKRFLESVLIAWSGAAEIDRIIAGLEADGIPRGQRFMLNGYGTIGRPTAELLRALYGFDVVVTDPDPDRRAQAEADGFAVSPSLPDDPSRIDPVARKALLQTADYIAGASGRTSVDGDDFAHLKPGAVLFNLSSSTVEYAATREDGVTLVDGRYPSLGAADCIDEFETHQFVFGDAAFDAMERTEFLGQAIAVGAIGNPTHWHRVARVDSGAGEPFEVLLANGLFPATFNGHMDPIRGLLIQVTRALLALACIEARQIDPDEAPRVIPVSIRGQRFIADRWMREVRQAGIVPPAVMALLETGYAAFLRDTTAEPDAGHPG